MASVTYAEFLSGPNWQDSSGPMCNRLVEEPHMWPIDDNALGAKDVLADGHHPVIAVGGRTVADGRPNNVTGVVISYDAHADMAVVNVANCVVVRAYVSNILDYDEQGNSDTWEDAPALGQPVYVDDSDDLGAGCTLSMSDDNEDGLANPLAGYLWYCQDEHVDSGVGGPQSACTFPLSWDDDEDNEYLVCVMLTNATP